MDQPETKRFDELYQRHLLKLQGKSRMTIDAYTRAVNRVRLFWNEGQGAARCA
ncbi:MAG: hypothetical protein KBH99_02180 [Syntrophobacteraceae bacterium]|nr:hypothetical protein [Syntrophobacteraceae bacterium]